MKVDSNPIQLLREVFKPLPPTAKVGEDGEEAQSVLDSVVISDLARILAEQESDRADLETEEEARASASESDEPEAGSGVAVEADAEGTEAAVLGVVTEEPRLTPPEPQASEAEESTPAAILAEPEPVEDEASPSLLTVSLESDETAAEPENETAGEERQPA